MNSSRALLLLGPVGTIALASAGTAQAATPTYYNSQAAFTAAIPNSVADPYSNPGYVFQQSNVAMSAVLGETDYFTTGHMNNNLVIDGYYCAAQHLKINLEAIRRRILGR